jgi:hypothetical protein
MPIRPENKALYPDDWKNISIRVRHAAGQKCQWCGKPNGETIAVGPSGEWGHKNELLWRDDKGIPCPVPHPDTWRDVKIILTVAHLDHDPRNNSDDNLRALCQRCHLRYDAPEKARRRNLRRRGRPLFIKGEGDD